MEADTHVQRAFPASAQEPSIVVPPEEKTIEADTIRAKNNILQWAEYLPQDCVKKMIEMGWDETT
jgi:predicted anti-sigma-YlaC factor YlaD